MARAVLMGLALLSAAVSSSRAQQSDYRRGFWMGLGAGPGFGRATCSICSTAQGTGLAGHVSAGGTISRRLRGSIEGTGWLQNGAVTDRRLAMISAMGTYYPLPELGLHARAGLGGYQYLEEDAAMELTSQGMALQLGVGYDVPLGRALAATPFATLVTSGYGNPQRTDKASGFKQPLFSDLTVRFFQIGVEITLY